MRGIGSALTALALSAGSKAISGAANVTQLGEAKALRLEGLFSKKIKVRKVLSYGADLFAGIRPLLETAKPSITPSRRTALSSTANFFKRVTSGGTGIFQGTKT